MTENDIIFEPHSDMSIDDMEVAEQHKDLVSNKKYGDAKNLIEDFSKGFNASLFNLIQNKIRMIQEFLLNEFVAKDNEFYSYSEPDESQMEDKLFWIQIY